MNKIFIVSECGINANGNVIEARRQIELSKFAGASAVKFQIYDTDRLFSKDFKFYDDSKRGMFTYLQHRELSDFSKKIGIEWFASPFHLDAVDLMEKCNVQRYKIASRSIFDLSLLEKVALTGKPVIMSCGLGREEDIKKAVDVFHGNDLTLLYCVSKYPTEAKDINLDDMVKLGRRYGTKFGLSSHCIDTKPTVEAVLRGAYVIEHHTTSDRNQPGCDQSSSLEYSELFKLTEEIKKIKAGSLTWI